MTQGTEEWYVAMANAIKARERAELGIKRWQEKLDQAEAVIAELASEAREEIPTAAAEAPEQAPVQE